jgi:hypothetical protein
MGKGGRKGLIFPQGIRPAFSMIIFFMVGIDDITNYRSAGSMLSGSGIIRIEKFK